MQGYRRTEKEEVVGLATILARTMDGTNNPTKKAIGRFLERDCIITEGYVLESESDGFFYGTWKRYGNRGSMNIRVNFNLSTPACTIRLDQPNNHAWQFVYDGGLKIDSPLPLEELERAARIGRELTDTIKEYESQARQ